MEEELAESQKSIPGVMGGAKVLGVQSYLDSSVNIRLVAPCEPSACYDIERLLRKRLLDRFKAEGIDIPYPIITLSGK
jgi:small-conductance mechanosensitive channel